MDKKRFSPIEEESEEFSEIGLRRLLLFADALLLAALLACTIVFIVRMSGRSSPSSGEGEAYLGSDAASVQAGTAETGENSEQQPADVPAVPAATLAETSGSKGNVNVAALQQQGEAVAAWIYCPGTSIDYPIVQGEDNEYYMEHDSTGKKNSSGAIYLDCRNDASFSDEQVMIYGNLMSDGSMFSPLVQYLNQSFFDQHPVFEFYTPSGKYTISVYSAHRGSPAMSNYPIWFMDAAQRDAFISSEAAASAIRSAVQVQDGETLISLVTSSDFDAGEDARVIVRGVMRPAA